MRLLKDIQAHGVELAAAELIARGFTRRSDGCWSGVLAATDGIERRTVTVQLPRTFPDALSEVRIFPREHEPRVAHSNDHGKLCLFAKTGLLVDAGRSADVIVQVLGRAKKIVFESSEEERTSDIREEFCAYWSDDPTKEVFSIVDAKSASQRLSVGRVRLGASRPIVGDSVASITEWCKRAGLLAITVSQSGYFAQLARSAELSLLSDDLTGSAVMEKLSLWMLPAEWASLEGWWAQATLPALLLLSFAGNHEADPPTLVALEFPRPSGGRIKLASKGFRSGKVPSSRLRRIGLRERVVRRRVRRLDASYLVARAGGESELLKASVAVIGSGAVGSHMAQMLAGCGVGRLLLVDSDLFYPENVYRHALGAGDIGKEKSRALAALMKRDYPSIDVQAVVCDVLDTAEDTFEKIVKCNVVVVALGEQTIERRLNGLFESRTPRIHVWLEPLGLGGHVLRTGLGEPFGCYECLLRSVDDKGLWNSASLAAPGQSFQKTFAGCSGSFTPFGALDAQRAAEEAARETVEVLMKRRVGSELKSWVVSKTRFIGAGFRLSTRGENIPEESCRRRNDLFRGDCDNCKRLKCAS